MLHCELPTLEVMKRTLVAISASVVLVNTAMVGASAVGALVAADALGETWSGAPNAASVLGTALGALGVGSLMARRGWRTGLLLAYALATAGGLSAAFGVLSGHLLLLIAGMLLLGIGNAAANLSRYALADLYPPERGGIVLGGVVWAGTIGAIVGPNLLGPTAGVASAAGLPPLTGAYVVAVIAMTGATLAATLISKQRVQPLSDSSGAGLTALTEPRVAVPMAAMVAANFTMVAVMTMTPVHVQLHGQGLHVVGAVISAHMIGMFALSPLAGRLADWRGGASVVCLGVGTLVSASLLAAFADPSDALDLSVAVFFLGLGWNLCWVGGSSSMLARGAVQVVGDVDAVVWTASAAASLLSGALAAAGGFGLVATVGGAVALLPLVPLVFARAADKRRTFNVKEIEA
jgi:MFS family permease